MVSVISIRKNSDSFLLFYSELIQAGTVCAAININTIDYMGVYHCTIQSFYFATFEAISVIVPTGKRFANFDLKGLSHEMNLAFDEMCG